MIRGEGTEDRCWVEHAETPPSSMSPGSYAVSTQDARVPMRDGLHLDGKLFLPDVAEPVPCVLIANGYGPPGETAELLPFFVAELEQIAGHGYACAHVWFRGHDVPDGETLYYRYREDGYDLVEWMAAQSWCDGNVGMVGTSLFAISQWLVAKGLPPSLRAIVPSVAGGDCYWYLWYPGGIVPGPGREERCTPTLPYDEYGAAMRHRNYDDWWRERNTETADHYAMAGRVAVLNVGGWDDYIFAGGVRATEEVVAAGGDGMQVIGPWNHVEASSGPGLVPYDFHTLRILWLDRFLKRIPNGIDRGGALIYVEGAGAFRYEPQWPIPDAHGMRLFLSSRRSRSAVSLNDGSLTAAPGSDREPCALYQHHPDGPHNAAGGGSERPSTDQRSDEEFSLTWSSEPLTVPVEVTGWPKLCFWASSTAPDTDFVAELCDVAPDGTSRQVGRGWLNGPRSFSRTAPLPLVDERTYRFDLELWPLSYVFARGHRIRLSLAGADHGGERDPQPFSTPPGLTPNPHPAKVSVFQDASHPSFVELPVVGTGWRQFIENRSEVQACVP